MFPILPFATNWIQSFEYSCSLILLENHTRVWRWNINQSRENVWRRSRPSWSCWKWIGWNIGCWTLVDDHLVCLHGVPVVDILCYSNSSIPGVVVSFSIKPTQGIRWQRCIGNPPYHSRNLPQNKKWIRFITSKLFSALQWNISLSTRKIVSNPVFVMSARRPVVDNKSSGIGKKYIHVCESTANTGAELSHPTNWRFPKVHVAKVQKDKHIHGSSCPIGGKSPLDDWLIDWYRARKPSCTTHAAGTFPQTQP